MSEQTLMIMKIMPTIMMILFVLSCLVYLYYGDYKHSVYWFSGALITYSVTWM
jgi:hypothetical protein